LVAALVVALCGVGFANRGRTRLRLAYPPGEVTVARDVIYVAASTNPKHRLDVYSPKDARGAPVVHFVHGGQWQKGDKDHYALIAGLHGSIGMALAKRGIVTVVQSYRLSPEVAIEGMVDDVMAGLRWTQTHATEHGGDAHRIFTMGHSAGGHLVAIIATNDALHTARGMDPQAVRGTIAMSAVWDGCSPAMPCGATWNANVTVPVFGADPARWAEWSPLNRLHEGVRPFFILIGERDYPELIPQAAWARDRLTALGKQPRYLMLSGNEHTDMILEPGTKNDRLSGAILDFVTRPE